MIIVSRRAGDLSRPAQAISAESGSGATASEK